MDPSIHAAMPYFGPMIDNLTQALGYLSHQASPLCDLLTFNRYRIGHDLHGAGYDWRLGPMGHTQTTAPGGYPDAPKIAPFPLSSAIS